MSYLTGGIRAAASALRSGEVTSVDLVTESLERIERSAELVSFITVDGDRALSVARAADDLLAQGVDLGPLHGLPLGLKDLIDTAGLRTTYGSKIYADHVPTEDATTTARLKAAGSVIVGKTNLHEFAWGGTTENPHYGDTRNPWNTEMYAAGSSGGSGSAVASGEVIGTLGTDTGGSIRLPAAATGIVGLRPTVGRVSTRGVFPLAWTMDTVGPMARTVEDVAIMTAAIAGADTRDALTSGTAVADYAAASRGSLAGLRIGVIADFSFRDVQAGVADAVQQAIATMVDAGATLVEVGAIDFALYHEAWLNVHTAEPSAVHQQLLRDHYDAYGEDVRHKLIAGELIPATQYQQAQRYRRMIRERFLRVFENVDVLITPTMPYVATPVGAETVNVNGTETDIKARLAQFTALPSALAMPGLSVPVGFSEGLPVGMQLIGKPFAEATLFRAGGAYQALTDWHTQIAPFARQNAPVVA